MTSQEIASTEPLGAFDRIPGEGWVKVAKALPANSLFSFLLSSRKIYIAANHILYRAIHFLSSHNDPRRLGVAFDSCFGVHRTQSWLSNPDYSSTIKDLNAFLKTITTNSTLKSHINSACFKWDNPAATGDILLVKRCLQYLNESISQLHLGLPNFDPRFAITTNATFLEIVYPDELVLNDDYINSRYDVDLQKSLRESLHSIFCIPTLRHLSIKCARTWQAFDPLPINDNLKAGTSNVISLSLPDTVPLSKDLKEILTWPKALINIYHENVPGDRRSFQKYDTEQLASAEVFIDGLQSQRSTIEEVFYNNTEDCCGHDGSTFRGALRGFHKLKRLAVSRVCLVAIGEIKESQALHEALPPNLEEAWIELESWEVYRDGELVNLERRLREIAMNKTQCFPSLRSLILWIYEYSLPRDENLAEARRILDELGLLSTFQDVGIRLEFIIGQAPSFGA